MAKDLIKNISWYCVAVLVLVAPRFAIANDDYSIEQVIQTSTDTGDWGDLKWNKIVIDVNENIILAGVTGPWTNWYDITLAKYSETGNLIWKKNVYTPGYDEALDLITDSNNFIYVSGISDNANGNSAYVGKFDTDGNLIWSWSYGNNDTSLKEAATGIAIDSNGNLYVCGYINGIEATDIDAFVAKIDNNGNQIWLKNLPGLYEDQANAIGVDGQGYIYVAGKTNATINDGPVLRSLGYHGFIVKMDPNGSLINDMYTNSFSEIKDLAVDGQGNVFITGSILAGEIKSYNVPPGPGVEDVLNFGIWHPQFSIFDNYVEGISGNWVYFNPGISNIQGSFPEETYTGMPSGGYEMDAFIAKLGNQLVPYYYKYFYDPTGLQGYYDYWSMFPQTCGEWDWCISSGIDNFKILFAREFGTNYHDQGLGVVLGNDGNSYVVGATSGNFTTGSNDQNDGYVAGFSDSSPAMKLQFGSDNNLPNHDDVATSMAFDSNGNLYVAGYTNGSFTGGQVSGLDGFFIKFKKVFTAVIPPVADPGTNVAVKRLNEVNLDGSKSFDADENYPLLYEWSFISIPQGSSSMLSEPQSPTPSFTADLAGEYVVQLVVTDAQGNSSIPKTITITAMNSVPVANAGQDQVVTANGTEIQLDGSGSWDEDGDDLVFNWELITPPNSQAYLSDPSSKNPTFVVDVKGDYLARLTVTDLLDSSMDEVKISFDNLPPVALAGSSDSIMLGQYAILDGNKSYDPNNDALSFLWSITHRPENSFAEINNPTAPMTQFLPDVPGEYIFELVVSDGYLESSPSRKDLIVIDQVSAAMQKLMLSIQTVNNIEVSSYKNINMQNPLAQKLIASTKMVKEGNFYDAKTKLNEDIMPKIDGCIKTGMPDKNDWVTECKDQILLYENLIEALQILK